MYKPILLTIIAIAIGFYITSRQPHIDEPVAQEVPQPEEKVKKQTPPPPNPVAKPQKPKKTLSLAPPPQANTRSAKYPNLDKSFAPFDADGKRYITQIVVQGKHLTFHGDLLLGELKDLEKFKKMKSLTITKPRTWPNNQVPFKVDGDMPVPDALEKAIDFINLYTNIEFVPYDQHKDYVIFKLGEKHCYSYVGRKGGEQPVYLSSTCDARSILHEMMHLLGFFHEQNREDRDNYVKVIWDNIPPEHHTQFKKMPDDFMHVSGRPFSFDTVMIYPSFAFATDPNEPSLLRTNGGIIDLGVDLLTNEDIERVNQLYPR